MTISWSAAGGTHIGRVREGNEDSFRVAAHEGIFLVADGMGGHAAGEVASALAADVMLEILSGSATRNGFDPETEFPRAFAEIRTRMLERGRADQATAGMGTTLTVAVLRRDGSVHVGHIGDSRMYRLHGDELYQITHDHTWIQQEVDAGRVRPEAARNHPFSHVLTRVLAVEEPAEPDIYALRVTPGDVLLLSSDGLHGLVDGAEILEILAADEPPARMVETLIDTANERGGTDNITALAIRIDEGRERAPRPGPSAVAFPPGGF